MVPVNRKWAYLGALIIIILNYAFFDAIYLKKYVAPLEENCI